MRRLNHPAYRHRAQQFLADAVLVAIAWALAFVLRFVDAGGIPERYEEMLWQSIAFVAIGKALIFTLLGLHSKWWRYFLTRDFPALLRATALASAALVVVFTVLQPFHHRQRQIPLRRRQPRPKPFRQRGLDREYAHAPRAGDPLA